VIIKLEKLDTVLIGELEPILRRNYESSGQFEYELEISWDSYLKLGDSFVAIVMRDKSEEIRGILFFLVSPYSHIVYKTVAQQITFYIEEKHRFYCKAMIEFSEQLFEGWGVDFILQSARHKDPFCNVLSRLNYEPSNLTFIKRIS